MDPLELSEDDIVEYDEGTTPTVERTFVDDDGDPIPRAAITDLRLWFYDADATPDLAAGLINAHGDATNGEQLIDNGSVTGGATTAGFTCGASDGKLVWILKTADAPIRHPAQSSELHVQLMKIVTTGGTFYDAVGHRVRNLRFVPPPST